MSALNEWNALADSWSSWCVAAIATSAVMFAIACGIWFLLKRRLSSHAGYVLFLLPLLPLAMPTIQGVVFHIPVGDALTESLGVAGAGQSELATELTSGVLQPEHTLDADAPNAVAAAAGSHLGPAEALGAEPTLVAWAFAAWVLIAGTLLAKFLAIQLRTHRLVHAALPLSDQDLERVRRLLRPHLRKSRLEYALCFVASEAVASPAAWGLGRPTIVLPPGFVDRMEDDALAWMLLHEVAHLERHDMWISGVQRVIQILWFFNPLVWLTGRVVTELRECACDETALVRCSVPKPRIYAEALLEVAAGRPIRPVPALALQSLQKESYVMKKRILRMIDPGARPRAGLAASALPMLLAVAGLPFASLQLESPSAQEGDEPYVQVETVEFAVEVDRGLELDEVHAAVERGVDWILSQQKKDGHWPTGPKTEADTGEFNSIGMTGFAILTLVEAEARFPGKEYRPAIKSALRYLADVQDAETGLFGPIRGHRYMASHAVATRAWVAGNLGNPEARWKPQAERAVAAILKSRNPYAGWRFDYKPIGDNDSLVTSLMLMALASAREIGIEIPKDATEGGFSLLDELYDAGSGRTGLNARGGRPARLAGRGEDFPAEHSEMCTSIAMVARMHWGETPIESASIRKGAVLLVDTPPLWSRESGTIDYYHWLFGSQALSRLGGYQLEYWRENLCAALLPNQEIDAEGRGWWPAVDAWSSEGATVHATLMNTLALMYALR